jgi:hypothetical protein
MYNGLRKIVKSLPKIAISGENNSKYHNVRTKIGDITFDSKAEALRFSALKEREDAGVIKNLRLQVPFVLHMGARKFSKYIADFVYENADGETVVEDVKNPVLAGEEGLFALKKRCMEIEYGIDVLVIDPRWVLAC